MGLSWLLDVAPSLRALQAEVGLSEAELRGVVLGRPALLGVRWKENVEPRVKELRRGLGLDDAGLRRVIVGHPPLLGLKRASHIQPNFRRLGTELGLDDAGLRELVVAQPSLLAGSWEGAMKTAKADKATAAPPPLSRETDDVVKKNPPRESLDLC